MKLLCQQPGKRHEGACTICKCRQKKPFPVSLKWNSGVYGIAWVERGFEMHNASHHGSTILHSACFIVIQLSIL
jgi:hypothetical protein